MNEIKKGEKKERKSPRLKDFDYGQNGIYFITICTKNKKCTLAKLQDKNVGEGFPLPELTQKGKIVDRYIKGIKEKYPMVCVDKYIIMPNHIHMLLSLKNYDGRGNPSPTISNVIGWLKYRSTKAINEKKNISEGVFQRSFYDHIVRNEYDFRDIWEYIERNPAKWICDRFYNDDKRDE